MPSRSSYLKDVTEKLSSLRKSDPALFLGALPKTGIHLLGEFGLQQVEKELTSRGMYGDFAKKVIGYIRMEHRRNFGEFENMLTKDPNRLLTVKNIAIGGVVFLGGVLVSKYLKGNKKVHSSWPAGMVR